MVDRRGYRFTALSVLMLVVLCFAVQAGAESAQSRYLKAETCYRALLADPAQQKLRRSWLECIDKFQSVYLKSPLGHWAEAGMYMSGVLYGELYQHSLLEADKKEALDIFKRVIKRFPNSRYRAKAEAGIRRLEKVALPEINKKAAPAKPDKNGPKDAISELIKKESRKKPAPPPKTTSNLVIVTGLRHWSNPNYTRVVVDASQETGFKHHLLKKDPAIHVPHQRLYIDLEKSRLGDIKREIPIHDNLLLNVRAGQYTPEDVRVVIDIKSFKTYKVFSLKNPFRIVIDVWGAEAALAQKKAPPPKATTAKKPTRPPAAVVKGEGKIPKRALAKQFALGVSKIVIDAGHGGRDYGAPGYLKGVHEKYIVLQLAKRLEKKVRKELKCEVIMTRTTDRYLTLEERTAIANTHNADLFISIHTNSHRDRRAYGFETYFLNLATDEDAIRVAALENATSAKNISDLQMILNDLMQNAKVNESSRLAAHVQEAICKRLKKKYSRIRNKGVKQAPFYVLLGAQMPAVLVEASFISNARECKRLTSTAYQDQICEGIVEGIRSYINEIHPANAMRHTNAKQG